MSMASQKKLMTVSPSAYAAAAVLANEVAEQMLSRLEWVTLQPKVIVDVGCGVGSSAALLRKRYPAAQVIALDIAYPMLQYAKQQEECSLDWVNADTCELPFRDHSVDFVFANMVLPWVGNIEKLLREWRRVLRPDGLLMFSGLGPDTLLTWRDALADITVPDLIDMHEIGDALTRCKFADPVLDVDYFTLTYRQIEVLYQELNASGMLFAIDQDETLLEKGLEKRMPNGLWSTTYEVVYGHAFGPHDLVDHVADEMGIVRIPLSHLRRRR